MSRPFDVDFDGVLASFGFEVLAKEIDVEGR